VVDDRDMSAAEWVRAERQGIADDLLAVGPDAPTLCDGWTARDLAAHLRLREARPDAAIGILVGPAAGWTRHVQEQIAAWPYADLVDAVRNGPPRLSPFSLPGVDERANLVEFAVHREDVRRGQPGWVERDLPEDYADALWDRARQTARMTLRRSPVGITLLRTDGDGGRCVVRAEPPMVTVAGPALELLLRVSGRRAVNVEVTGNEHAVRSFDNLRPGF